ncbi:MAG: hypothetical protein KJO76_06075 [Gammaproteobacteria bacterium]|nr:hypothetical protein [Gammaproteobacteria bacterium]MBT8444495.1 hypothetical protein [Gammaproteobacteria bacterium]
MEDLRGRQFVALTFWLAFSCASSAAIHDWTDVPVDKGRNKRLESPDLLPQATDSAHMLQLYETWMVELFCKKSRNREKFSDSGKACTPETIQKLVGRCSEKIRRRGAVAYFKDAPDGAEFMRIVQAYQGCLGRGADQMKSRGKTRAADGG